MIENVTHVKSGITINVDVRLKNIIYMKQNPATCSCKNGKYLAIIIDDSLITCDEILGADDKSYDEETKTIPKNVNEKKQTVNRKFFCLTYIFINCHCITDSSWHLLLFDKISSKKKKKIVSQIAN